MKGLILLGVLTICVFLDAILEEIRSLHLMLREWMDRKHQYGILRRMEMALLRSAG